MDVSVLAKKFQNFWKLRLEKDCKKFNQKSLVIISILQHLHQGVHGVEGYPVLQLVHSPGLSLRGVPLQTDPHSWQITIEMVLVQYY